MSTELDDTLVFVRVAELRSFAAAARALDRPKSSVSRSVARLETRLGVRLLYRDTRRLGLTDAGATYFAHVREVRAALDAAEAAVEALRAAPAGLVRVSASYTVGRDLLAPHLGAFVRAHPAVRLALRLTTREVDQIGEEVDVAVHVGALPDSSLVARRLASMTRRLYASPAYLAARGAPAEPEALASHDVLDFGPRETQGRWVLGDARGTSRVAAFVPRVTINDPAALRDAAIGGAGISALPEFLTAADVAAGRLAPVLREWAFEPTPLSAVYPSARALAPAVRAFVDFLADRFRPLDEHPTGRSAPRSAPVLHGRRGVPPRR